MKVKIKKLSPEAHLPRYMKSDDSAMDLVAITKEFDEAGNCVYGTGLAIEIPVGYVGLIFPRSSNSKKDLLLCNSVGVIDPGCTKEIVLRFKPSAYFACEPESLAEGTVTDYFEFICFGKEDIDDEDNVAVYSIGDRIGQLLIIPRPTIEWEEVYEFTQSAYDKMIGGFGTPNSTAALPGDPGFQGSHLL